IGRAEPLRHNALAAELAGVLEYDAAFAFVVLVEHDAGTRDAHELGKLGLAVLDRRAAQILAVEFDQVKGAQYCLVAMPGPANELENRQAAFVSADRLTVNEK